MPNTSNRPERRSSSRTPAIYRLDVADPDDTMYGYLADISAGGMRVRHAEGMEFEQATELRIDFPRWLDLGPGLVVQGRVVWYAEHEDSNMIECGFAFDALSAEKARLLEHLSARLAKALHEDGLGALAPDAPLLDDEAPLSRFF